MNISIAVSYPNGAVATICIPLAESAKVSVSTLPKQEGGLETAKESQQSDNSKWTRESNAIYKSLNELDELLAAGEKEEDQGIGRIGGMGERKERGEEEEKPDLYAMTFDAIGGQYAPPHGLISDFIAAYGQDVVERELHKARAWLTANSNNRKTIKGMGRFLNSWLCRAQKVPRIAVKAAVAKPAATGSLLEAANNSQEGW